MAEPPAPRPRRPARARGPSSPRGSRRRAPHPSANGRPTDFRGRLRHDPFLFVLCLACLGFTTCALALTWWLLGGLLPIALAVLSLLPAFYLFYIRDSATA